MDELEKELAALREATQPVTASQALKSELLLAAARAGAGAGAAATVTTISLKLVLVLVAAGAVGGATVWSLTRESEPPPPPAPAPKVEVSIAVVTSPPPATDAGTPVVALVPVPQAPVTPPPPIVQPAPVVELQGCAGARHEHSKRLASRVRQDLRERIGALGDVPPGELLIARVFLPPDRKPEELLAPAPFVDGWIVGRWPRPAKPVWLMVPGYQPIALDPPSDTNEVQAFVAHSFERLGDAVDLAAHVSAPYGDVTVSLAGEVCGDVPYELPPRTGREVVFKGLTKTHWRVTARSPGNTSAEVDVTPDHPGRIDVPITLESARHVMVQYRASPPAELCRAPLGLQLIVPGEHFILGKSPTLWLPQKNHRVQFDRYAGLSGGYLGQGSFEHFCTDPTPIAPFGDREVFTGDVYMVVHEGNVVLMRFTVQ